MKKIVFGILSFLLISPVFADDFSSVPLRSFVSFESINSNYNLTYTFFPFFNGNDKTYGNTSFFNSPSSINPGFIDSSNSVHYNLSYFYSQSIQFGSVFNPLIGGALFFSGSDSNILSLNNNYNPFIFVGGSNNIINPSRFAVYFQGVNSGVVENSGNLLLRFGNYYNTGDSFLLGINDSFIRLLYRLDNFWFKDSSYLSGDNVPPYSIQIFPRDSQFFFTEKGRFSLQNTIPNKIISSFGNGFSFINKLVSTDTYYLDDLDFYSVLPNWDSYFSNSSSSIRFIKSGYIDGLYIFKLDSFSKNTDFQNIGVLSKCNIDLCSGLNSVEDLLSSMVFSNYLCDFSKDYDLKNNCELAGGGILLNVLNTTGLEIPLNLNYNGFIFDLLTYSVSSNTQTYYNSNFLSLSLNNTPYSLSTHIVDVRPSGSNYHNWFQSNSYNITYTGGYSVDNPPDILSIYDFSVPELSHGSGALEILCQDDIFGTNPLCKNDLGGTWSDLSEDGSGNLVLTIYDDDSDMPGPCDNGYFTGEDGRVYYQYFDSGNNYCIKNYVIPSYTSSPEIVDYFSGSDLIGLESSIGSAFSDIIGPNFKFYSCPFRSPLKAFHLSSIGGLSDFLLDKFFDVNITGPFNCLLGGILYSETDSQSLGSQLLLNSYNGEKYLNNFPDNVKSTINRLLFALMILFFWSFRPKEH